MLRRLALLAVSLCAGCASMWSPLPNEVVLAAAEPVFNLGHPNADYGRAEIVGSSGGSLFGSGTHDSYVDLDVHYQKRGTPHIMRLRFYVHSTDPCHITTDVLQDSGPPPILLDNGVSSKAVGEQICAAIAEKRGEP